MTVQMNPYLSFSGDARAAMELYQAVFGGDVHLNTFGEYNAAENPADAEKVMHARLEAPGGFLLMASDVPEGMQPPTNGTISLSGDDAERLHGYWDRLSDGGAISMPLEKQMWGDEFGMLTDRFGVPWMVDIGVAG